MDGSEGVFGHLVLVLLWNLACCSANTCLIQLKHFQWADDSFQIFFAHQKNNQTSERMAHHPHNVYPNSIDPIVCPLLSLSLYFMVFPDILAKGGALFPGNNLHSLFRYIVKSPPKHKDEVVMMGQDVRHVSIHSICKGAALYVSLGRMVGLSGAVVNLQVGWMLGHVQDTYIWYEAAGDQYVSHMLLGLLVNLYKFALVDPHFVVKAAADDDSAVLKSNTHECISSCFLSSFPMNFTAVLMHGFACCLFNFDAFDCLLPAQQESSFLFSFQG